LGKDEKTGGMMKETYVYSCDGIPYGCASLKWQYGSWWITDVIAARTSTPGSGFMVLINTFGRARDLGIADLRLGTHWSNKRMLHCALRAGFILEGTDHNGYILKWENVHA
jgi:RimJ/RimL family protein N-acetyltransferase